MDNPGQQPYRFCAGKSVSEMLAPANPRYAVVTHRPWMEAYCSLDEGEIQHRTASVLAHAEGFGLWMGVLALYHVAFSQTHDLSHDPPGERLVSANFRLDLLGLAGGNVKLALDAALAGYYSGCMALERHMLETWRRVVYARLHSRDIWRWLPQDMWPDNVIPALSQEEALEGKMPTWPTSAGEIAKTIRRHGDEHDRLVLPRMESGFKYLNHHSHPTLEGATRTWDPKGTDRRYFGPTFSDLHAVRTLEWGLFAGLILLTEVGRFVPEGGTWGQHLNLLKVEVGRWGIQQKDRLSVGDPDSSDNAAEDA